MPSRYMLLCAGFFLSSLAPSSLLAASVVAPDNFKIIGQIDTQYDFVDADDKRNKLPAFGDPDGDGTDQYYLVNVPPFANTSQIQIRRLRLGVDGKFAQSFRVKIVGALDLKNNDAPAPYADRRDLLEQAWLRWQGEIGDLRIGYAKLPFGIENMTPSRKLPVIERSLATLYFTGVTQWGGSDGRPYGYVCTPLGLGARGNSVLWRGNFLEGTKYHIAVANNVLNPFGAEPGNQRQDWGIYLGFAHEQQIGAAFYDVGVNAVWRSEGVAYFPIKQQRFAELYAFNPYIKLDYQEFHLLGEYFHGIAKHGQFITGGFHDDGAADRAASAPTANSHGVNVLVNYDLSQFSVVGRYSFLDTGGAGFSSGYFSDVVPGAPLPFETNSFDKAHAFYAGLTYRENFAYGVVRISIGYEFARASDELAFRQLINSVDASDDLSAQAPRLLSDAEADIHSIRFRVQSFF